MPASPHALLYVGIKRHVLALDAHSGEVVWETELPKGAFATTSLVVVHAAGGLVYAACAGELTALDAHTGAVVWENELKGYGTSYVTLATAEGGGSSSAAAAAQAAAHAAAVAAAGAGAGVAAAT